MFEPPEAVMAAQGLCRPEPDMTLPRSAADVLASHVTLEVECIDRMYLNVYQPRLQHAEGVVQFLRSHRGYPIASSALLEPISRAFIADLYRFAADRHVPIVDFVKGQRKDDVAHEFLAEFDEPEGVLFVGRAQEKDQGVPHRETPQPAHRGQLPVDCGGHGHGQPLLCLCRRRRFRSVLHQVLLVLSL